MGAWITYKESGPILYASLDLPHWPPSCSLNGESWCCLPPLVWGLSQAWPPSCTRTVGAAAEPWVSSQLNLTHGVSDPSPNFQAALWLPSAFLEVVCVTSPGVQGRYHPVGSTLTKERRKVKKNEHINSSPCLLDEPLHMISYGLTKRLAIFSHEAIIGCLMHHFVFAISPSLTDSFLLTLAALELYPLLSNNINIYPGLNLSILG